MNMTEIFSIPLILFFSVTPLLSAQSQQNADEWLACGIDPKTNNIMVLWQKNREGQGSGRIEFEVQHDDTPGY